MSGFYTLLLPILLGSLAISAGGIAQRWGVVGLSSPLYFLAVGFTVAAAGLAAIYVSVWGLSYPQHLRLGFWQVTLVGAMANVIIMYMGAYTATYDAGEVSFTAPLFAMTPGIVSITAALFGELPGLAGTLGLLLMMAASWILMVKKQPEHWWGYLAPLERLRLILRFNTLDKKDRERAIIVSLALVSMIFSTIAMICDGLAVRRGGDLQGMYLSLVVVFFIIAAVYIVSYLGLSREIKKRSGSLRTVLFGAAAFVYGATFVPNQVLIKPLYFETYIAYVGTLYRIQILITILMAFTLGWLGVKIFREEDRFKRFGAAVMIVTGALLIASEDLPARLTHQIELLGF